MKTTRIYSISLITILGILILGSCNNREESEPEMPEVKFRFQTIGGEDHDFTTMNLNIMASGELSYSMDAKLIN